MVYNSDKDTTKQKILACAAILFAEKGFTETTTRELAEAVGIKAASLYNHFPSKTAILEHMLEDYRIYNTDIFKDKNISQILRENPTSDGILTCLQTSFPPDRAEYFLKVLCVLLQEQLRNPIVGSYMSEQFILRSERNARIIIEVLKELGVIRQDADPDFWVKASSSLFYFFATRMMLGIGDKAPGFKGMGIAEMLKHMFDMMLEKCGTAKAGGAKPE
jgi:AcrR family transcriptional regulator